MRIRVWTFLLVAATAPSLWANSLEVSGLVHSARYEPTALVTPSFHLMLVVDPSLTPDLAQEQWRGTLIELLQALGYGAVKDDLMGADEVVVVRLGVEPDRATVDTVLAGNHRLGDRLPTGLRFVQFEAYDLPQFVEFLRYNENAADDVNAQFQTWRTTVQSRGPLAGYADILPALLQVAQRRAGLDMPAVESFRELLPLAALSSP